ncbi:MAG TPA: preprotein translocase subunit SecE [Acidimicrobiales bacterium]
MNREQKRAMQRQGQDPDGEAAPKRTAAPPRRPPKREPFRPGQFLREVRSELRQVAWPNRSEVINYTTVTLVTLLSLMVLIFILNYAFAKGVFWLFKT